MVGYDLITSALRSSAAHCSALSNVLLQHAQVNGNDGAPSGPNGGMCANTRIELTVLSGNLVNEASWFRGTSHQRHWSCVAKLPERPAFLHNHLRSPPSQAVIHTPSEVMCFKRKTLIFFSRSSNVECSSLPSNKILDSNCVIYCKKSFGLQGSDGGERGVPSLFFCFNEQPRTHAHNAGGVHGAESISENLEVNVMRLACCG